MEKKMRFGLVLARLAILKKIFWANYEQLLTADFHVFKDEKWFRIFLKIP